MRLQQEANKKIEELADRAHTEAISYVYQTYESCMISRPSSRHNEANSLVNNIAGMWNTVMQPHPIECITVQAYLYVHIDKT